MVSIKKEEEEEELTVIELMPLLPIRAASFFINSFFLDDSRRY